MSVLAEPAPVVSTSRSSAALPLTSPQRITSIDALRGLVMFTMIYVNDIAGAGEIVPNWMVHFSDRHRGGSGMTFVDLVFPAFLFIVGMSIPFALRSRIARGEPWWKLLLHVLIRSASLLMIGILMVNGERGPNAEKMGWSRTLWAALLFLSAIFAFCTISPPASSTAKMKRIFAIVTISLRVLGFATLLFLALAYRDRRDGRILTLSPFHIRTEWYGILGLIGWAYLVASVVYLLFRNNRTALLACTALLLCFYAADRKGFFNGFFLSRYVGMGEALGSLASISTAGVLLSSILLTPDTASLRSRLRFTLLFIAGCAFGAMLLNGLYGISKNNATPSWCLWSCAITATLWLIFYIVGDVLRVPYITRPFAIAGQNVLLAYLISEGMGSWLSLMRLGDWYDKLGGPNLANAIGRSLAAAFVVLALTALLNRLGFRLKL
jgi:predicted acyltransferase